MHFNDYIPRPDNLFLAWIVNFLKYLFPSLTRLNFPHDVYQNLTEQRDDFTIKLEAAEDPSTRTPLTVAAKNASRKTLEESVRQAVKEYLINNHLLTEEDFKGLGLPIHKTTRTPSPVATTYPEFFIDSSVIRRVTIHFFDQGKAKSKAKPAGQHGAEIRWAILDMPPASVADLIHSSFDTHTPFTLEFDENQRGKTVYFCLCWENTRGEKGPWSEIGNAIIP
jgi:hypothetical protein